MIFLLTNYANKRYTYAIKIFGGVLMDQTTWVIQVLDDSNNRSIEYQNRSWLRQNIEKLNIRVCVEDCVIDTFGIAEEWANDGSILIQGGKSIQFKADFHPGKEALQLIRRQSENDYLVFLYSPKE
jgi:hypothetical protein